MTNNQKNMYIETVLLFNKKTWKGSGRIKRCIRLCMTGARATSGGDGPRWGRLVRSCRGLEACGLGPFKSSRRDVGVPGGRARAISGGDGARGGRLVRSCRWLEGCGLGPIMKSGVSDPSYRRKAEIGKAESGGLNEGSR